MPSSSITINHHCHHASLLDQGFLPVNYVFRAIDHVLLSIIANMLQLQRWFYELYISYTSYIPIIVAINQPNITADKSDIDIY